jgi:hypothetical protein
MQVQRNHTEVYLDTNAWSDLFRRTDLEREDRLRRALVASAHDGRYRYVTSGWAIEELGGLAEHDWPKYREMVTFVLDLIGGGLILQSGDLVDRELRVGRPLRGAERFFSIGEVADWHKATEQPDAVRAASAETRARKRASVLDGRARRESSIAKLEDLIRGDPNATARDGSAATREWYAEAPTWIEEWGRDVLAGRLVGIGRDAAEATTYPLDQVPTVRNVVAQMVARIAWNVGHGRRIDEGDDADTQHYAAACYADIFVCGDVNLGEIIALIPDAGVAPMRLRDFAQAHLGGGELEIVETR